MTSTRSPNDPLADGMSTIVVPTVAEQLRPSTATEQQGTAGQHRVAPLAKVARGAFALLTTQPLTWTTTILTTALVPRYLGDSGFGLYALATTIATVASMIAALGVPSFWTRRMAVHGDEIEHDSGAALFLVTATALLITLCVSLALPFAGADHHQTSVVRVVMLGMVMTTGIGVVGSTLLGRGRHTLYAWFNAGTVASGGLAGIAVLLLGGGLAEFAAAGTITAGVCLVIGWKIAGIRLHRGIFDRATWMRLVLGGAPFMAIGLVTWIYLGLNNMLLAALASTAAVGWYTAAFRIVAVPVFIPTLISTPLLPVLSQQAGNEHQFRHSLRNSLLIVMVLSALAAAVIAGMAPAIPRILGWGHGFDRSAPLIMILVLQQPLVASNMILGAAIVALHLERRMFRLVVAAAFFNPTLNLLLIPFFERTQHNGAIGVAIATVATEALLLAGMVHLLPRGTLGRTTFSFATRVAVAALSAALVTAATRPVFLLAAPVAGGVVYLALIVALRVVRLGDLWAVRHTALRSVIQRHATGPA